MPTPSRSEFIALIKKYQERKASPEEIDFIRQYFEYFEREEKISSTLSEREKEYLGNKLFRNINRQIDAHAASAQPRLFAMHLSVRRIAAAIIFLMLSGSAAYYFFRHSTRNNSTVSSVKVKKYKNDIAPGGSKAILTLNDGTKINLDSAVTGTISQQGVAKVSKFNNGLLAYHANHTEIGIKNSPVFYNTINTPRGGQYQVMLSDGSKVWLNAASSLRFPTVFNSGQRVVELTGEAYFEVAHLDTKGAKTKSTFTVKIINAAGVKREVEVLGTHFNINAYQDEAVVKTTLLEGSVKMTEGSKTVLLTPGQQVQTTEKGDLAVLSSVDVNETVAWKNGMFAFKKADIKTIMRQIARWYDVEIEYEKNVDEKFYAEISRNTNVTNVFRMLEETGGVHFEIDGKKIIVKP